MTALVIHGLGGIGKSTLAAQIASRVSRLAPERVVTVLSGEVSAASLVAQPAETDLVVLDDFDDNLTCESGLRTVRDPALAALLAGWTGKLLITCGTAFTLPPADRDRFVFRHLGPLTRSGAAELAMSLPALRVLGEPERDLAWRLTAGHPRAMEYLDALLAAGLASTTWPSASPRPSRPGPASPRPRPNPPSCPRRPPRPSRRPRASSCSASCSSGSATGPRTCSSARPCSAPRSHPACWPPARPTSPSARPPGCSPRAPAAS